MDELVIFELDLTGGTCGFPAPIPGIGTADQIRNELIRRNKVVRELKASFELNIERKFLKNISFLDDEKVKTFIFDHGIKKMPVFLLNGTKIIHFGSFPDAKELASIISNELRTNNE